MRNLGIAAAAVVLALLTFFQFPGHTYLQQDTQIYVPILEHLRDPAVLRNEILAEQPHVDFTLYDETALLLRGITGLDFRYVLGFGQLVTRAFGILGLYLMVTAMGISPGPALLVTSICSLGVPIAGPMVMTVEYEPTPRAFAVPLLICAVGLTAHRRYLAGGIAGAFAFLHHPPTAVLFWGLSAVLTLWPAKRAERAKRLWGLAPLLVAAAVLLIAARNQAGVGEAQTFFARLETWQEQLQRWRAPYVWISAWPPSLILHYALLFVVALAAFVRVRHAVPLELRLFLLGLPILGMASMPASWLLLEHWKWALMPQFQPLRAVLFVALVMQFLAAAAGVCAAGRRRFWEAAGWLALAYALPLHPVFTEPVAWSRVALALALGLLAAAAVWPWKGRVLRFAPAAGVAAFFAIPALGGVVNGPAPPNAELTQLSLWARNSTSPDAVFLFADAGRAVYPGVFRSEALRAVYVDWKGGGQVNFLRGLGSQWFFRWRQTLGRGFKAADFPRYDGLGIDYVVLEARHRVARAAVFENAGYVVYRIR